MNVKTPSGKNVGLDERFASIKTVVLCNVILEAQAEILSKLNNTTFDEEQKKLIKKYDDQIIGIEQQLL
jgi:hypothetical protein